MIFPEATLTVVSHDMRNESFIASTVVPAAAEEVVPCSQNPDEPKYGEHLAQLSCLAKSQDVYLVVNLLEKEECRDKVEGVCEEGAKQECNEEGDDRSCAEDGWNLYNTDVVFDRGGTVIARYNTTTCVTSAFSNTHCFRYRKFNLFGEYALNTTFTPEVTTFRADYGIVHGIFTCFDILFPRPALDLIANEVTHIIFPTMWFSELPFLTGEYLFRPPWYFPKLQF